MDERLITFLYLLLRDELPAGSVANLMRHVDKTVGRGPVLYTNKHIEGYAREIAARLIPSRGEVNEAV